jgi:pyrroloquinoline quinone biosynthesis protein E
MTSRPWTLIAELTYACPLRCAYCSNPVQRGSRGRPLMCDDWRRLLREAEALGVVQVHFTGGEPLLYGELEPLVAEANSLGLYTTLVTSGVPLRRERLAALATAGLEHVQLSLASAHSETARLLTGVDQIEQKLSVARWVKELGLSLTLNVVLTRQNIDQTGDLIALAEELEPDRLELANVQYLGWALVNRAQLLPSAESIAKVRALANQARARWRDRIDVVVVLPDYHAGVARACMDGWASRYLVVTPDGQLLPCHAAHVLRELTFDDVRSAPLAELWARSPALEKFRGDSWMKEPCASCAHKRQDFGGCRCQAYALTGDAAATDPACRLAPLHGLVRAAHQPASQPAPLQLRRLPRLG